MKSGFLIFMCLLVGRVAFGAVVVAHYTFDDPDNMTADSTGNGNSLSVFSGYGTPEYSSEGRFKGAASFDGSTQGWVINNNIYPEKSFSFTAWVKPLGASAMITTPWSLSNGFNIYVASGKYRFLTYYGASKFSHVISSASPQVGEWQHIAMTYEVTSGPDNDGVYTGTIKGYVNGKMVGTLEGAQYISDSSNDLAIGRRSSNAFTGLMDEIYIYGDALSAAEIEALAAERPKVLSLIVMTSN